MVKHDPCPVTGRSAERHVLHSGLVRIRFKGRDATSVLFCCRDEAFGLHTAEEVETARTLPWILKQCLLERFHSQSDSKHFYKKNAEIHSNYYHRIKANTAELYLNFQIPVWKS